MCLTHMLWFNFIEILGLTFFSLFWGMVMYDESKKKGNKIILRIKLNHNICVRHSYQGKQKYHYCVLYAMSILYLSQLFQLTFSALQT